MGTVERQYNRDFGVRSDKQLGNLLKEKGVASLNDMIESDLGKKGLTYECRRTSHR